MTHDDPKRQRSSLAVCLTVGIVLLPFAYVLSVGPAVWMLAHGYISDPALQTIYAPLGFVVRNYRPMARAIEWYCGLWISQ